MTAAQTSLLCGTGRTSSNSRQDQFSAQAADRGGAERQPAAIETGQFDDDREPEAGARLALVKPSTTKRDLLALLRRKAGAVIIDDDPQEWPANRWIGPFREDLHGDPRLRPLAGVVDQIADHLLEVLTL